MCLLLPTPATCSVATGLEQRWRVQPCPPRAPGREAAQLLGVRSGTGPELVFETFSGAEREACSRSTRSSCRISDTLLTQIKGAKPFFWALRTLPPLAAVSPVAHGRRMPKEPGFHPPAPPPSSPLTASPGGGGPGAGSCAFRMK